MNHEKKPLESKKFWAYLLAEISWKLILVIALLVFKNELQLVMAWGWWFMCIIVIVAGFIEAGFIGGQAWIDRYVRVAQAASGTHPGKEKNDGT